MTPARIAVVGATGLVGSELLAALSEANVAATSILPLASERSEGESIEYGEEELEVEKATVDSLRGSKVVVVACPADAAAAYLDGARHYGALTVDLSGLGPAAWLRAGLGPADISKLSADATGVVIASPASSLVASLSRALAASGLKSLDVTVLWSAARRGRGGVMGLEAQTAGLMNGRETDDPAPFPHRLAFNIIPSVGKAQGAASEDEARITAEVRAMLTGAQAGALTVTSLWVPTFHGAVFSFSAHTAQPVDVSALQAALKAEHFKVLDDYAEGVFPMPMLSMSDEAPQVGRLRADGTSVRGVAVVDNVYASARTAASWAQALVARVG